MSNSVIAIAALFSRRPAPPVSRSGGAVAGNDLEFLAREIERATPRSSRTGTRCAPTWRPMNRRALNKAIDAYQEEVQRRGCYAEMTQAIWRWSLRRGVRRRDG